MNATRLSVGWYWRYLPDIDLQSNHLPCTNTASRSSPASAKPPPTSSSTSNLSLSTHVNALAQLAISWTRSLSRRPGMALIVPIPGATT